MLQPVTRMLNTVSTTPPIALDDMLTALKAAGEATRLRILALLAHGDMTVKDMTTVLGQSQPRISRHLKLLVEARLIQRFPEGAWAYYRLTEAGGGAALIRDLARLINIDDPTLARDRERLEAVKAAQRAAAQRYFAQNAAAWDELRGLHAEAEAVEAEIRAVLGERRFGTLVDLGTGTGRILVLLKDLYERGIGVDSSPQMLAVARAKLDEADTPHAQIRQGDVFNLAIPKGSVDVVTIHQVLHFLDDPGRALREAARVMRPGARLVIVDFAPHGLEFLREEHAHRRLGFSHAEMQRLIEQAGLDYVEGRDLATPGEGKLTVSLWLARDPRVAADSIPALEIFA